MSKSSVTPRKAIVLAPGPLIPLQAQAVPCHPCSPASMRSRRISNRSAVALFIAPENSGSLRHSVIVSGSIPARRLASSSVNPMATASAILATTSGVRLVGRPSPSLPRLLTLCAGSPFMSHFSFFVWLGNSFRLILGRLFQAPTGPPEAVSGPGSIRIAPSMTTISRPTGVALAKLRFSALS